LGHLTFPQYITLREKGKIYHPSEKIVSKVKAGGYICGPASIVGLALLPLLGFGIRRKLKG